MKNACILNDNRDFLRLYRRGNSVVSPVLVTYARRNGSKTLRRVGITATKKIGGAVQRNRAKRLIRAAWLETEQIAPGGWDLVFVARGATPRAKFQEVRRVMGFHLSKLTAPKGPGQGQGKKKPSPQQTGQPAPSV